MPVSLTIVDHKAETWQHARVATPEDLFKESCPERFERSERLFQSSFSRSELQENYISPSKNGFVWAAYHAYSTHHHLTIRPEDVWFAILTQLGFFINANAEELRSFFVSHEGKKKLTVIQAGSASNADFGFIAKCFTEMIAKNVKDPELRTWIMPSFSTTTDIDSVVASVLFMGAMQNYFEFKAIFYCGIPSVTLLGEIEDWQDILTRLDKIEQLGDEPAQFAEMLRLILRHMILSFTEPTSEEVIRFWNTIGTRTPVGSGTDYISGWIAAFCYWDEDGRAKKRPAQKYGRFEWAPFGEYFVLDGVPYPIVDIDKVPTGIASVPVKVDDNGHQFDCTMLAGSFGIQASSNPCQRALDEGSTAPEGSREKTESLLLTAIHPLSGWLMYQNESAEGAGRRQQEIKDLENQLHCAREAKGSEQDMALQFRLHDRINFLRRL